MENIATNYHHGTHREVMMTADNGLEQWPEHPVVIRLRGVGPQVGLEVLHPSHDDIIEVGAMDTDTLLEALKHLLGEEPLHQAGAVPGPGQLAEADLQTLRNLPEKI